MKPHYQVPIQDCGEPLVSVVDSGIALQQPHTYEKLGAPYGDRSPYFLRQGVLTRLLQAQERLREQQPNWTIQIFDAYRPIAVQQFMVDHTLEHYVRDRGLQLDRLTDEQRRACLEQVYQFWAVPSRDPRTPPPHSTGAAIDVLLIDASGRPVEMGSPIDEMSDRSYPDHFSTHPDPEARTYHRHRQCLRSAMRLAGFRQHPQEWWHFSFGDQLWAWLEAQVNADWTPLARYGGMG